MSSLPSRGAVPHLPEGVTVNAVHTAIDSEGHQRVYNSVELIHYVMDLEALVRWLARTYAYEDQEGEWHQNEPIWTIHDEHGNYFPENERLQRTWKRVFDDA